MTALRRAVVWATALACPWSSQDIARLCGNDLAAVRNYLSRLHHEGVLALLAPDSFQAGLGAAAWRKRRPRTKEGGGARAYREAKETRDRLAQADWQARRAGQQIDIPTTETLTGHTVPSADTSSQDPLGADTMQTFTPDEAAATLNVSTRTVRRMARRGELRAFRVGPRLVRFRAADVLRLVGGQEGALQPAKVGQVQLQA